MVLVVGSTGFLGSAICTLLAEKERPFRALVRKDSDPAKVKQLEEIGADLVQADLKEPETLKTACAGIDQVISTASTTFSRREGDTIDSVDRQGQLNLVEAASAAGVKRFVYISFRDLKEFPCPLNAAKRAVEKALMESGMTYTALQPTYFMEVWLSPGLGFDYNEGKARILGTGEQKNSFISLFDVAKFAVAALDNPAAENRAFEIGGPEPLSWLEAVRIFEETSEKKFEVEKVPMEALEQQRDAATNPLEESFAGLMLSATLDWSVDIDPVLRDFPMKLKTVREYAQSVTG
jgi:NADH dehydrogenase